ncbi:nucleotidyltransferase family protein [soil metagenome]
MLWDTTPALARFDAIIPAGGTLPDAFAQRVGVRNKTLIEIGGQTILARTLAALRESGDVRRTVLVGEAEVRNHPDAQVDTALPAVGSAPMNILEGLRHLSKSSDRAERVLVVTSDLPYLTAAMLNDFVERCPTGKDFCVPLVTAQEYEARFAGSSSSYVKLTDGHWTIGGTYLVRTEAFERALPHIERAFEQRKSTLGMVRLLGPAFAIKFLTKRLAVPAVLGKVESLIRASGFPVRGAAPELAYDVDDETDYDFAKRDIERHG